MTEGTDTWQVCMHMNFAIQYKVHMYISALAHTQKPAAIFIDRI